MEKTIYKEYSDLKTQQKEIEKKLDVLKEDIMKDMKGRHVDELDSYYGNFYYIKRKVWKYSDNFSKKVRELKNEEIEKKIAKQENIEYIIFI